MIQVIPSRLFGAGGELDPVEAPVVQNAVVVWCELCTFDLRASTHSALRFPNMEKLKPCKHVSPAQ